MLATQYPKHWYAAFFWVYCMSIIPVCVSGHVPGQAAHMVPHNASMAPINVSSSSPSYPYVHAPQSEYPETRVCLCLLATSKCVKVT